MSKMVSNETPSAASHTTALDPASHQILTALGIGVLLFDKDLRVLYSTPETSALLALDGRVDTALSKGTDSRVWDHWTETLKRVVSNGEKALFRSVQFTGPDGIRYLDLTCIPIRGTDQESIMGALLVENTGLQSDQNYKKAHAERQAAIGKIAGQVAHELNNPLDGIQRYLNLAIRVLEPQQNSKALEYLGHCRSGLRRMAQVLSELLDFSRSPHLTCEQAPLDRLLEEALHTLHPALCDVQVQIHRHYTGPALPVRSDSLFQVFCNLIKNAADAMEGKGLLTITLSRTAQEWAVAFQDTGPGFPPQQAEAIFQPFFTTKPYGRGTGLGLSICRDILEKFGGRITAANVPEGGSLFTVILPHSPMDTERKPSHA